MATATATAQVASPRMSRWTYLLGYLVAVIVAEILIAIPGTNPALDRPFQSIGLAIHILLVFTLMIGSVYLQTRDAVLAPLLVAASLASLVRVFSLAVPRFPFFQSPSTNPLNTIPWLALVSVPLLVSVGAIAVGGLVIFLATGLSEELIFRGILLKRAVEALGERSGLLYVTALFASLHIFFLSAADLVFVFAVGLFYGVVVLRTKNLWGAILSHSLGNVMLYLVAPFH